MQVQADVLDWQSDVTGVTVEPGVLSDTPFPLTFQSGKYVVRPDREQPWRCARNIPRPASIGFAGKRHRFAVGLSEHHNRSVANQRPRSRPWPIIGFDELHTAQSPFNGPSATPSQVWSSADKGVTWSANYAGASISSAGLIYVATTSGLFCLDSTGSQVWTVPPPFASAFPPPQPMLTASGAVIVCWSSLESNSDPQGIYAYKQSNGDQLWATTTILYSGSGQTPKGFSVYDSPALDDNNTLAAVAREHVIVGLNLSDGSQKWLYPNDPTQYAQIVPGSYLDAWRTSPAVTSKGVFAAVASWFDTPRLVLITDSGFEQLDQPLKLLTTVNCHPLVTNNDRIVMGGFVFNGTQSQAAVEEMDTSGFDSWTYTDDTLNLFQGVAAKDSNGLLYFLDGTGLNDPTYPNDYSVYVVSLKTNGLLNWRKPVFTRPSATNVTVLHLRNGITLGNDGMIYVSASWRLTGLDVSTVSGVAAMDG